MLLSMKSMWKNTCLFEKRPWLLQETSGTMFFKAWYNFFSEFLKKFQFSISIALKMTIQNNFFVKNICQKNLTTKLVKKNVEKKIENRLFFYKKF